MSDKPDMDKFKQRILDQVDSASCERLADNFRKQSDKTIPPNLAWKELADTADRRSADLLERETNRRPNMPYHQIGLPSGTILKIPGTNIEAEVFSNRTLSYKGREIAITTLEDELADSGIPHAMTRRKWVVKDSGESVTKLYREKYPKK